MSSDNEVANHVIIPIFKGDKNFKTGMDSLLYTPILFYKLSDRYYHSGHNCVYFHLTDSALYLVNGDHPYFNRMTEEQMVRELEKKYLAKYPYTGWCTMYGKKVLNWDIASAIQHDIFMVIKHIKEIYDLHGELNASPVNTIGHDYNFDV